MKLLDPIPRQAQDKSAKTNWNYIILFILISAFVTAGLIGYVQFVNQDVEEIAQNTPSISAQPKDQIDTSNWQTYRNEELGFELKYPPTLNLSECIYPEEKNNEQITENFISYLILYLTKRAGDPCEIKSFVSSPRYEFSVISRLPINEESETWNSLCPPLSTFGERITIDGIGTIQCSSSDPRRGIQLTTRLLKNEHLYIFSGESEAQYTDLSGIPTDEEFKTFFNQILSTFRFVE